jgi:hypothetical protein
VQVIRDRPGNALDPQAHPRQRLPYTRRRGHF